MKNLFTAIILAQGSSDCVYSHLNLGGIRSTRLLKGNTRSMNQVDVVPFSLPRDIWKEKCGGWQLTLTCPSVQPWVMIQHFASGNYLPSTVCWRYGNSKKVPDITLHVCKSIHKQQNVLDTFMYSTNIYWEHLLCDPEYAGQREFNVGCYMEIQHMENYSRRLAWSISAQLCYSFDVPCTAQTFASWGQYALPLLIESCATRLKYISL